MDLNHVRAEIDRIDGELIRLLAERQHWVETTGRLKPRNNAAAVAAPDRVAHALATRQAQANSDVVCTVELVDGAVAVAAAGGKLCLQDGISVLTCMDCREVDAFPRCRTEGDSIMGNRRGRVDCSEIPWDSQEKADFTLKVKCSVFLIAAFDEWSGFFQILQAAQSQLQIAGSPVADFPHVTAEAGFE